MMMPKFYRLNHGWNADPNIPDPLVEIQGRDVLLRFKLNYLQYPEFREGDVGVLRFVGCECYRLGDTNDEGWYLGQCRFSKLAPAWGEFYSVLGESALLDGPDDWIMNEPKCGSGTHFLFYFRENTFECVAEKCILEDSADNSLFRTSKLPDS